MTAIDLNKGQTEILQNIEAAPDLKFTDLTYKGQIERIAMRIIKDHGPLLAQNISWLKDSPILTAADKFQINAATDELPATIISPGIIDPEIDQVLFKNSWQQFLKLAHAEQAVLAEPIRLGLNVIKTFLAKSQYNAKNLFEKIFVNERQLYLDGKINERDTINGEKGVYWQNIDLIHTTEAKSAETLQLFLASSLIHFMRNQLNLAGHLDQTYTPSDSYHNEISEFFAQVEGNPPQLLFLWDKLGISNERLLTKLKKDLSLIDAKSEFDTHDQTAYFPHGSATPDINHPDLQGIGIKSLKVRIFHPNGLEFCDANIRDIFNLSSNALEKYLHSEPQSQNSIFDWIDLKKLKENASMQPALFSLALNKIAALPKENYYLNKVIHSLELTTTPEIDHLRWKSGHFSIDGAAQSLAMSHFVTQSHEQLAHPTSDFFEIDGQPSVKKSQIIQAKSTADILGILGLREVVIGHIFDQSSLVQAQQKFNEKYIKPQNIELQTYLKNKSINAAISQLIHLKLKELEKNYPRTDKPATSETFRTDILNKICALLNPSIATVDALAIASEDTGPSTTCALTISPLRRLVTYLSDKIDQSLRSIKDSFLLTATERIMSKLGLGSQAFLASNTVGVERFSQMIAGALQQELAAKAIPLRQISDLGPMPNGNYFVTASSGNFPELAEAIGVTAQYLTARVDLTKTNFIEILDLSTPFTDHELTELDKLFSPKRKNTYSSHQIILRSINTIIAKQKPSTSYQTLMTIIQNEGITDPSSALSTFLIAKTYLNLIKIPQKATAYLEQAIIE